MKSYLIIALTGIMFSASLKASIAGSEKDSVMAVAAFKNFYKYDRFFISGQPTLEALQWLKSEGVQTIISLRTEKENQEFASTSYNEALAVAELGMAFRSVEVDGMKDYTPLKLGEMAKWIKPGEKVLIHCASAGRATYFFMGWLISYNQYDINRAVGIGKSMAFSFPLESLLGEDVTMDLKVSK